MNSIFEDNVKVLMRDGVARARWIGARAQRTTAQCRAMES